MTVVKNMNPPISLNQFARNMFISITNSPIIINLSAKFASSFSSGEA